MALDADALLAMTRDLVRAPSRGGVDPYGPVVEVLTGWMDRAGLAPRVLSSGGGPVAVVCDIHGTQPGPHLLLDAPLDTAGLGDETAWSVDPFAGTVRDGWLYGRGAADSKSGVAVFTHVAARLAADRDFPGRVTVLADLDEHTGGFAGIRAWLAGEHPDAAMIGYPGHDRVVTGGRGVWRCRVTVPGEAGHSGSSRPARANAAVLAARLVSDLEQAEPVEPCLAMSMPPKVTVTSVTAGVHGSFSVIPDSAVVEVDVRLVPYFDASDARALVESVAASVGGLVEQVGESWPPFHLPDGHPLVAAVLDGARSVGWAPAAGPAGPSNIGCLLGALGIPATAGFGVVHRGLHATDEAMEVASLPLVRAAYGVAVRRFLGAAVPVV